MAKVRLDQLLVDRGLAPSRSRAQALVMAGTVFVDGARAGKPGGAVAGAANVEVRGGEHPFVSRGGVKLAGALDTFAVDVQGLRCLDLGASTGGFTDCLLQRGAASVIAVDVGYGQLAYKLRVDPRVIVMERTNARTLTAQDIGDPVDLTVVDASFIGIEHLLPATLRTLRDGGHVVALVKPQFEVGREEATRGKGVVRDPNVRGAAIDGAVAAFERAAFEVLGRCDSSLPGPKGNLEAFVHARKPARTQ
jgi:23S rRNA (cytidine1920-2'-O)/16S rRNA (cytidine1409-2'-O)-methyltransferase